MKTVQSPRPSGLERGPRRLMTTFYPGDMDKVSTKTPFDLTNDSVMAHKLLQWFRAFQELTQMGADLPIDDIDFYNWRDQALNLLTKSKEFM